MRIEKENYIRNIDEGSLRCGIFVKKEWECGIRNPRVQTQASGENIPPRYRGVGGQFPRYVYYNDRGRMCAAPATYYTVEYTLKATSPRLTPSFIPQNGRCGEVYPF